LNRVRQKIGP